MESCRIFNISMKIDDFLTLQMSTKARCVRVLISFFFSEFWSDYAWIYKRSLQDRVVDFYSVFEICDRIIWDVHMSISELIKRAHSLYWPSHKKLWHISVHPWICSGHQERCTYSQFWRTYKQYSKVHYTRPWNLRHRAKRKVKLFSLLLSLISPAIKREPMLVSDLVKSGGKSTSVSTPFHSNFTTK